jgi:hypothetical protein
MFTHNKRGNDILKYDGFFIEKKKLLEIKLFGDV